MQIGTRASIGRIHIRHAILAVGLVACGGDGTQTRALASSDAATATLLAALTPELQNAVGPDGLFRLPVAADPSLLSEVDATALAAGFVREFATRIPKTLEEQHGGPINFADLAPCGRRWLAASSYVGTDEVPPEESRALYEAIGPRWIVGFCEQQGRGATQLSVAVPAHTPNVRIENGKLLLGNGGNALHVRGVPADWNGSLPLDPEHAAIAAYQATGRRVSSVPRLVGAPVDAVPQAAQWRMALAAAAGGSSNRGGEASMQATRTLAGDVVFLGLATKPTPLRGPTGLALSQVRADATRPAAGPTSSALLGFDIARRDVRVPTWTQRIAAAPDGAAALEPVISLPGAR